MMGGAGALWTIEDCGAGRGEGHRKDMRAERGRDSDGFDDQEHLQDPSTGKKPALGLKRRHVMVRTTKDDCGDTEVKGPR